MLIDAGCVMGKTWTYYGQKAMTTLRTPRAGGLARSDFLEIESRFSGAGRPPVTVVLDRPAFADALQHPYLYDPS